MNTTVVGNYPKIPNRPRPARLRAAIARFDRGEIGEDELHRVQDEVTQEVIDEQVQAGIDLITDGQIRWDDEVTYFARRLTNVSINGLERFFDNNTYYRQPVIEGPIAWSGPVTLGDYRFAAAHSPKPVKAVLTGPYTLSRLSLDEHDGSLEKLTLAYAEAVNAEARALQEAGCPVIQLNEPALLKHKDDFALFEKACRRALDRVSAEKALYFYFGDVGGLYPQLLDLPIDTLGLDFVSGPRNWELIDKAPFPSAGGGSAFGGKKLGLGIVDGRNTRMEAPEAIASGVQRALKRLPPERLYVNPNCGLEFLPREVAQAKLARMVEAVRRGVEAFWI